MLTARCRCIFRLLKMYEERGVSLFIIGLTCPSVITGNSQYHTSCLTSRMLIIMKSFTLACAVMLAWIFTVDGMWYDEEFQQLRAHEGAVTACTGKNKQLSKQMFEVKCDPRPTLVKLTPPSGYTFFPNYVLVKRCDGFCPKSKSCMPSNVTIKEIPVRMHGFYTKDCFNVFVEEHQGCKCQCSVKENHCNIRQQYSPSNCACECMNKKECNKAREMIWNEKMCKCVCTKSEETCSSGLEWIPSLCGCAKVMEMYDNVD